MSSTMRFATVVSLLLALGGCKGREKAADDTTATIAPAQPQPAPTGTDEMTQTVDIEDSRSVSEGATSDETTTSATTTAAPAWATACAFKVWWSSAAKG